MALLYAVVCGVGVFSNTVAYVSLRRTPPSTPGRTLLRHQCFLDAALCVAGFVLLTQTPMWHSGLPALDAVLCRLWHSDFIFTSHAKIAGWCILTIVVENVLIATGSPCFSQKVIVCHLCVIYVTGYVSGAPDLASTEFVNNSCINVMTLPSGLDPALFYQLSYFAGLVGRLVPFIYLFVFIRHASTVRSTFQPERHSLGDHSTSRRNTTTPCVIVVTVILLTMTIVIAVARHYWETPLLSNLVRHQQITKLVILSKSFFGTLLLIAVLPTYRHALASTILCRAETPSTLAKIHC